MTKRWPKVKDIAERIGVTPRSVVDFCHEEGLPIQNRITRVPPEIERAIRAHFLPGTEATDSEAPASDQPLPPPGDPR